jgi:predicted AAA+ superfamily ATPase
VKAPKVYVRDSGILHTLLGLRDAQEVMAHPRFGLSWEGFALEHAIRALGAERDACFWGTHAGAEIDLVVPRGGRLYGIECRFDDAPSITRSLRAAMDELDLAHVFVVHPGTREFPLADTVTALPLARVGEVLPARTGAG